MIKKPRDADLLLHTRSMSDWENSDSDNESTKDPTWKTVDADADGFDEPTAAPVETIAADDDEAPAVAPAATSSSPSSSSSPPPAAKEEAGSDNINTPKKSSLKKSGEDSTPGKAEVVKQIDSLKDFKIKNMQDVDLMLEKLLKPKLFPEDPEQEPKAKNVHYKMLLLFLDAYMHDLDTNNLEKLQALVDGLQKTREKEATEAEKKRKKELAQEEERLKQEEVEKKKQEAKEKGEEFVDDEDFFAGLM